MKDFSETIEESVIDLLIELKKCVNNMIVERIKYNLYETSDVRLKHNKNKLKLDYKLLEIIINKIDNINRKEDNNELY